MTPAVKLLKKRKVAFTLHEYEHDAKAESYGLEAAEKLNLDPATVFKTLVVQVDGAELVVGIIPVAEMLSMKQVAKAAGGKKAVMAGRSDVERATGYVLGGVSPLGQKKRLRTLIDSSAEGLPAMFVSAGRRGMDIGLAPHELQNLLQATFAPITQ